MSKWKWYGYPCHFVGGKNCIYHLATKVGEFLISTIGDYYIEDNRQTLRSWEKSFYETCIFVCSGEDKNGNPIIEDWTEIDGRSYETSVEAENEHYEFCKKYSKIPLDKTSKV